MLVNELHRCLKALLSGESCNYVFALDTYLSIGHAMHPEIVEIICLVKFQKRQNHPLSHIRLWRVPVHSKHNPSPVQLVWSPSSHFNTCSLVLSFCCNIYTSLAFAFASSQDSLVDLPLALWKGCVRLNKFALPTVVD